MGITPMGLRVHRGQHAHQHPQSQPDQHPARHAHGGHERIHGETPGTRPPRPARARHPGRAPDQHGVAQQHHGPPGEPQGPAPAPGRTPILYRYQPGRPTAFLRSERQGKDAHDHLGPDGTARSLLQGERCRQVIALVHPLHATAGEPRHGGLLHPRDRLLGHGCRHGTPVPVLQFAQLRLPRGRLPQHGHPQVPQGRGRHEEGLSQADGAPAPLHPPLVAGHTVRQEPAFLHRQLRAGHVRLHPACRPALHLDVGHERPADLPTIESQSRSGRANPLPACGKSHH